MENENMNQQVKPKRTKTIVIIGCVLIVIGLGIGLFIYRFKETTEKVDPVVENARRNSMKSTAQQVLYSLRTVLTDNFELYPGTYEWDENLFDVGGINSPFGGKYIYSKGEGTKIGSSFYRIDVTKDITVKYYSDDTLANEVTDPFAAAGTVYAALKAGSRPQLSGGTYCHPPGSRLSRTFRQAFRNKPHRHCCRFPLSYARLAG